jgi:hypothetical protein
MNLSSDKRIYQIALTLIPGVGDITARNLLQIMGDEEAIFKRRKISDLQKQESLISWLMAYSIPRFL